jgi:soluble cytochrome b562
MIKIGATTLFCLFTLAVFSTTRADTPLEGSMKKISKAFKQLTLDLAQPADANKSDYVALANSIKTEAQTSSALVPKKAAALPADQQATMVTAYQKSMKDFSTAVDVLIQELQDGKWADANKQLAILKQDETDGHKQFRLKE